jgi:hypothetical protein
VFAPAARAEGAGSDPGTTPPSSTPVAPPPAPPAAVTPVVPVSPRLPRSPTARIFVAAGASVFTVAYLAAVLGATTGYPSVDTDESDRGVLFVPVVGPFIALGSRHDERVGVLYALDGAVQTGSLALFVLGLAVSPPAHVRVLGGSQGPCWSVSIVPRIGVGMSGAAVTGTF